MSTAHRTCGSTGSPSSATRTATTCVITTLPSSPSRAGGRCQIGATVQVSTSHNALPAERQRLPSGGPSPDVPAHDEHGAIGPTRAIFTWAAAWAVVNVIGGVVVASSTADGEDPSIAVLVAIQLLSAVIFGTGLLLASTSARARRGQAGLATFADWRRDYRLAVAPRDLVALPLGVATQLLVVPLVYLPLRELWPDTFNSERLSETAGDLVERAGGGLTLAALFLAVCLVAPVVEELVYRGLLQGALMPAVGRTGGWLIASALFALIHFRPVEYPGLFAAGLVFGGCLALTGRLAPAIMSHLAFNVTGLLLAL